MYNNILNYYRDIEDDYSILAIARYLRFSDLRHGYGYSKFEWKMFRREIELFMPDFRDFLTLNPTLNEISRGVLIHYMNILDLDTSVYLHRHINYRPFYLQLRLDYANTC